MPQEHVRATFLGQQGAAAAFSPAKFSKKFRLTKEELDYLFPERTYANWLSGGATKDALKRDIHTKIGYSEKPLDDDADGNDNDNDGHSNIEAIQHDNNTLSNQNGIIETVDSGIDLADLQPATSKKTTRNNNGNNDNSDTKSMHSTKSAKSTKSMISIHQPPQHAEGPHYDSDNCAICIEEFESSDIVRGLICGHVFHKECVDPWLSNRKACCPLCKRDYYLRNRLADETGGVGAGDNSNETSNTESGEHGNRFDLLSQDEIERLREMERQIQESRRNVVHFNVFGMRTHNATTFTTTATANNHNNNNHHNTNTGTNSNNNSNTNNAENGGDNHSDDDLFLHNIQAYNEYLDSMRPLSVRAAEALSQHPELEEIARLKVEREFYSWKYRFFWRLMGISKQNLVDSVIVSKYGEITRTEREQNENEQREQGERGNQATSDETHNNNRYNNNNDNNNNNNGSSNNNSYQNLRNELFNNNEVSQTPDLTASRTVVVPDNDDDDNNNTFDSNVNTLNSTSNNADTIAAPSPVANTTVIINYPDSNDPLASTRAVPPKHGAQGAETASAVSSIIVPPPPAAAAYSTTTLSTSGNYYDTGDEGETLNPFSTNYGNVGGSNSTSAVLLQQKQQQQQHQRQNKASGSSSDSVSDNDGHTGGNGTTDNNTTIKGSNATATADDSENNSKANDNKHGHSKANGAVSVTLQNLALSSETEEQRRDIVDHLV